MRTSPRRALGASRAGGDKRIWFGAKPLVLAAICLRARGRRGDTHSLPASLGMAEAQIYRGRIVKNFVLAMPLVVLLWNRPVHASHDALDAPTVELELASANNDGAVPANIELPAADKSKPEGEEAVKSEKKQSKKAPVDMLMVDVQGTRDNQILMYSSPSQASRPLLFLPGAPAVAGLYVRTRRQDGYTRLPRRPHT